MAHASVRPFQERMALFWHGHFCSGMEKVVTAAQMQEQIDLFRLGGLGDLQQLAKELSTQVAMIRYLDNNRNHKNSPNQNFGRELLELFLLGVGNYTEADVEASTAAWTGHGEDWQNVDNPYLFRPTWHDNTVKQFLDQAINNGGEPQFHGYETIDVVLGNGVVPIGAMNEANRGRPTAEVAAEFLSRKLWASFAGTPVPAGVMNVMTAALQGSSFEIAPWVRTMLVADDFYATDVMTGLVRSPIEFVVAMLDATGKTAAQGAPGQFLMDQMGQRPFYPPDVSGWKTNGYWVNAGYMAQRALAAQYVFNQATAGYSLPDGAISLSKGQILRTQVIEEVGNVRVLSDDDFVDQLLQFMDLQLTDQARAEVVSLSAASPVSERVDALLLILLAPELHLA